MRLCTRFFAKLRQMNLFKSDVDFRVRIPDHWTWFMMPDQQILLFLQDPIHLATKIRHRLLSSVASMRMGDSEIDVKHLIDLVESKHKLEHNLIKCDIDPKDRQNFASYLRISSEVVLNLMKNDDNARETYLYLSLLRLVISRYIDRSTIIEQRLRDIWTVVFTCRLWWTWLQYIDAKSNSTTKNKWASMNKIKEQFFITRPAFWSIEINAHTLLYIVLLDIDGKLPTEALNTYLFTSQPCESMFVSLVHCQALTHLSRTSALNHSWKDERKYRSSIRWTHIKDIMRNTACISHNIIKAKRMLMIMRLKLLGNRVWSMMISRESLVILSHQRKTMSN